MNKDWLAVFESLRMVYTDDAYSNTAINEAVLHHKGCKESFVRNFAKGVLRSSIRLDWIIDSLAQKGIGRIKSRTLIILRMGIYAADSLDSVPEYAAVSESVKLAKSLARGTEGFVNAVLRSYIKRKSELTPPAGRWDLVYSVNEDIVSLLREQYGDETEDILKGLDRPPQTVLRVNRLKADRNDVTAKLAEMGIDARASEESPDAVIASGSGIIGSELFRDGRISVQSLSSMLAVEALAPRPGSNVLDMCAAPGGKSAYMAEMMNNEGIITSCDIYEHKLKLIDNTMKRLGIDIVNAVLADGTEHKPEFDEAFDFVLADVPCSGLGVMGSKPELRFRSNPKDYAVLIETQEKIIGNAVKYLKPGGRLEYSTCTLNKDENERIIEKCTDGSTGSLLSVIEMKTLLPYNNKVGFFYCIMQKNPA